MNCDSIRLRSATVTQQPNMLSRISAALMAAGFAGIISGSLLAALCWGLLALLSGLPVRQMGLTISITAALVVLIAHRYVIGGLMTYANTLRPWLIALTGKVILPYADDGSVLWFLLPLGGLASPWFERKAVTGAGWCLMVAGMVLGAFDGGWYLLPSVLGTLGLILSENGRWVRSGLLVGACLGVTALILLPIGAPKPNLSVQTSQALHSLLYDHASNSMPEGQLSDLSEWRKSTTPALSVTMEVPQKLYLRGFTGQTYTGHSWEPMEASESESDLFYWLHDSQYYGITAIAGAAEAPEPKTMTIRNLSACSAQAYVPYALYDTEALDAAGIVHEAKPSEELHCTYLPGSVPDWYAIQSELAEHQTERADSLRLEQSCRQYALDHALQLTPDAALAAEALLGNDPPKSLAQIRFAILDALGNSFRYDDTVRTDCGNGDFFRYVQSVSPKGYSVHYATAATLLLRYCGVPARYVEGYYLPPAEAAETVILTEENAHAWAEYYLDGVGWIPFETTPGYIDPEEILPEGSQGRKEYASQPPAPPVVQPNDQQGRQEQRGSLLWLCLLPIPVLAVGITILIRRRRRLRNRLRAMEQAEPREAVALLFGYARFLLPDSVPDTEAVHRNRIARFSPEPVTAEDRAWMLAYVGRVVESRREASSPAKKLYERYVRCIYR